jgi:single-strand DNA-binding protein
MLNQAQVIGNMTADPELKETPNGHHVATFSLATNRKYKNSAGVLVEETDYHNIVAWQ